MKRFHTNHNWRKVLLELNQHPHGASGRCIANRVGFSLKKTDGILRRMREKNLSTRMGTVWLPVPNMETEVQFQLDNVAGWISIENYEAALIKARGLVEALEKINHQQ